MKSSFLLIFLYLFTCSCVQIRNVEFDVKKAITSADIKRTIPQDSINVHLYQGNGRFGCSYGAFGLHVGPNNIERDSRYGRTQYMNLDHFVRAKYGSDYLLPLSRIFWENDPVQVSEYEQVQSFFDGVLTTSFNTNNAEIKVESWFDAVGKELAGINISVKGKTSDIILSPGAEAKVHYNQQIKQDIKITENAGQYKISLSSHEKTSYLFLKTNANVTIENGNLRLTLNEGENSILLSTNQPVNISAEKSLTRSIDWWNTKWNNIGCLMLPDENAQKMWVRSMAYFLSSYSNEETSLAPPCVLSGNGWPFPFPQDLSYVSPVLFSTGNADIVKLWVEKWGTDLSDMKKYTKRLLDVDGIMCPWVYPYGNFEEYHTPEPPNIFYYEIHNSGYLAKMADDASKFVNKPLWTEEYAKPIIKETAEFYKSISNKEDDGLWHIFVTPSVGQDERGGRNQKDYLCALFSAKYCFQKAIEYNLDEDGSYSRILEEGLAFPTLMSSKGYYFSCAGSGEEDFGKQKHPVQLNALTYLPVDTTVQDPGLAVYNLRYDITADANNPYFYGWSLGTFLLAGSRIGDIQGWKKDWANLYNAELVDPEWVQVYETSRTYDYPFYLITNGLIVQSLINNLVSDWYGLLEIAKCNPWEDPVMFKDIYSHLGVKVSGIIESGEVNLEMEAWKDCSLEINGEIFTMKKGNCKNIEYAIK